MVPQQPDCTLLHELLATFTPGAFSNHTDALVSAAKLFEVLTHSKSSMKLINEKDAVRLMIQVLTTTNNNSQVTGHMSQVKQHWHHLLFWLYRHRCCQGSLYLCIITNYVSKQLSHA